jgi:polyhydroxyalkanoate synthase
MNVAGACDEFVDPDEWLPAAKKQAGSWWPAWAAWLTRHSAADRVAPPAMGAPDKGYPTITPAPGVYVREP